ncbi:stalk domain-containing protein [Paenibacillus sp. Leaf72]|uniref:stalk domain-containing protein n=1 Tax=Paenibacillus sp. Leaf72 TaxID=1736234 RepID=UPI00070181EE|nr:stalk domain-containing protein [Paenibacillus sp. Leaf72]KQO18350.1 hypothetical protein ASF12_06960 [Paenibacillus sp. Leaf72]
MIRKLFIKNGFVFLLVIACMLMPNTSVFAADKPVVQPIRLLVQDKEIKPVVAPIIRGGRVYVEFRSVVKELGFTFHFDKNKKIITARSEVRIF